MAGGKSSKVGISNFLRIQIDVGIDILTSLMWDFRDIHENCYSREFIWDVHKNSWDFFFFFLNSYIMNTNKIRGHAMSTKG